MNIEAIDLDYLKGRCGLEPNNNVPRKVQEGYKTYHRYLLRAMGNQAIYVEQMIAAVRMIETEIEVYLKSKGLEGDPEAVVDHDQPSAVELWDEGVLKYGDRVLAVYQLKEREGAFHGPMPDGKHCKVHIDGHNRQVLTAHIKIPALAAK